MIKCIWNVRKNLYNRKEIIEMGFLDALFSSSSGKGGVPDYLKREYEKFGLDPDNEISDANEHKKILYQMPQNLQWRSKVPGLWQYIS